jgi:hypothetical protein
MLLSQNPKDWEIYQENKFISYSSGDSEVQVQGAASSCCFISWWKAEGQESMCVRQQETEFSASNPFIICFNICDSGALTAYSPPKGHTT